MEVDDEDDEDDEDDDEKEKKATREAAVVSNIDLDRFAVLTRYRHNVDQLAETVDPSKITRLGPLLPPQSKKIDQLLHEQRRI